MPKNTNKKRGKGIKDWFKKLGNKDTWVNFGNKINDVVKLTPIQNAINLGKAAKDAAEGVGNLDNWKEFSKNPIEWNKNKLSPWIKNNKILSNTFGLFGPGPVAGAAFENAAKAVGMGLKRKRSFKRKSVKRGGKLF